MHEQNQLTNFTEKTMTVRQLTNALSQLPLDMQCLTVYIPSMDVDELLEVKQITTSGIARSGGIETVILIKE